MKPKINRYLNSAKMHFGPNVEILTLIGGDYFRADKLKMG